MKFRFIMLHRPFSIGEGIRGMRPKRRIELQKVQDMPALNSAYTYAKATVYKVAQ